MASMPATGSCGGRINIADERAGLFDAVVPPGESIELELGVPLTPGEYVIRVEMIDRDQNAFSQFGVEPVVRQFRVVNE